MPEALSRSTSALAQAVAAVLHPSIPAEAGLSLDDVAGMLAPPKVKNAGDLAFGCFRLAKALRNAPPKIAAELADALPKGGIIKEAVATGPFLNLTIDLGAMASAVLPALARGLGEPVVTRDEKVMVEYSQPNTHKAFHVGHMRNVSLGDALVRLLRAHGHEVVAANYLGDVGAHIAKCLWWYLDMLTQDERTPPAEAKGEWLGELYAKANNQLAQWEDDAKAGDADAQAKLEQAKARTTEILLKLEARDPELTAVWKKTRQWSLEEFDEIYAWSKVVFDRVFYESEVDEPGLTLVQDYLEQGVFVESEGAVGIFNEEIKHMPFFMLRKRDGTSLYSTKDLALAKLKFEEYAIDRSIYVVDMRQSDHFKHVFLTLKKMGFEQAEQCHHVPYEMVELPEGAMSTRKGTVILFRALRERMLGHLEEAYLAKYRGDWSDEEIAQTAHALALGAIKYGMLNRDVNQKIVFDLEAWMNLEGNTGPYIQYSAARLGSILRKAQEAGKTLQAGLVDDPSTLAAAGATLEQPEERELMSALDGLAVAVHNAAEGLKPSTLCTYLHGLAKAVNRFSTSKACKVIDQEGDRLQGRLLLVTAANEALRWGLWQLGIPSPARM
ncbi:MAG: arginine--tRNA ligase [Nannocystaceae bacterium]|nr:arginine--tRNA ligase [bacterium]